MNRHFVRTVIALFSAALLLGAAFLTGSAHASGNRPGREDRHRSTGTTQTETESVSSGEETEKSSEEAEKTSEETLKPSDEDVSTSEESRSAGTDETDETDETEETEETRDNRTKETTTKETTTEETTTTAAPVYEPYLYNGYLLDTVISRDTAVPQNFILAYDTNHFPVQIQAFYSPQYRLFVYHGSKDAQPGYYVLDKLHGSMIPFILAQNTDGEQPYVVTLPSKTNTVPGVYMGETSILLTNCFDETSVEAPAFLVKDKNKNEVTVLYLASVSGSSAYYVYSEENGLPVLTEWEEYAAALPETTAEKTTRGANTSAGSSAEETTQGTSSRVSTASASQDVSSPEESAGGSVFRKPLTWLLICVFLFLLVLVTILIVFRINRRQDEEEALLAPDFDRFGNPESENGFSQDDGRSTDPFDYSFEDAFPEELGAPEFREAEDEEEVGGLPVNQDEASVPHGEENHAL